MPLAIFGIDNTAINLGITFAILALVAIWIALIVFTFGDARRRIADPFLVGCATAASLFPFVGTIVYSILRPPEFLEDVRERETEMKADEARMRHLEANSCRKCGFPTQPDYLRCPGCRTRLKEPCASCDRPVGLDWKVCPYCEKTLIAPKRSSRSRSKESAKSSSKEGVKSGSKGSPKASRRKSASDDQGKSEPERRSGRRATRKEAPAPEGASREGDSSNRSERSTRSATRSGRRKTAVTEEDTEPSHKPINGGDSTR